MPGELIALTRRVYTLLPVPPSLSPYSSVGCENWVRSADQDVCALADGLAPQFGHVLPVPLALPPEHG